MEQDFNGNDHNKKNETQISILQSKVEEHIIKYKSDRDDSRLRAKLSKSASIVFGGVTTIILGLSGYIVEDDNKQLLSILALILSAFTTALATWESFSDYRGKWIRSRATLVNLYNLRDELRFEAAGKPPLSDDKIREYFERLVTILEEANDAWTSNRWRPSDAASTSATCSQSKPE